MPTADLAESAHLRIRPTMLSDLDFVVSVEQDARNLPFITPWERTQHEGAIRFPDSRHFIVEAGDDWARVGFVILQGCRNPNRSVELKRIVLQTQGRGLGRACVRLLKQTGLPRPARAPLLARRASRSTRARCACTRARASSRKAGCARACAWAATTTAGWDSLVVMSHARSRVRRRASTPRSRRRSRGTRHERARC